METKFSASRKGILFVISGPSGVGKGTLTGMLLEQNHLHLQYSISATTRPPRVGGTGERLFLLERSDFEAMIARDEFWSGRWSMGTTMVPLVVLS